MYLAMALSLACFVSAPKPSAALSYHVDTAWPLRLGRTAPDYGRAEVMGVAAAPDGRIYVVQRARHPVLIFDRGGSYIGTWGEGLFTSPHNCRLDPRGNLWITDNGDHRVMEFTTGGRLLFTLGTRRHAGKDGTHFNRPADVAFGPNGDIYVADGYGNARVAHFSGAGRYLGSWGSHGTSIGQFRLVHAVAVDRAGNVYVADRANQRIQIFTASGRYLREWTGIGHPFGLFLTPDQRMFVCDGVADRISIYDLSGRLLARWGRRGNRPGELRRPHNLCVDASGGVYVTEVNGRRVQRFLPERSRR